MASNALRMVNPAVAASSPIATPTADRIEHLIAQFSDNTPLPTQIELSVASDEIEAALIPAPENMVEKAIAVMLAGYPSFRPEPLYIAGLVSDLAAYPLDVVMAATGEIRRTQRFFPTHAEIISLAEIRVRRRHKLRYLISKASDEVERREAAAEKARNEARIEAERLRAIEARASAALGRAVPEGCTARAVRFMEWDRPGNIIERFNLAQEWKAALDKSQPWAVRTLLLASLITETIEAGLDDEATIRMLKLAETDIEAARDQLASIESRSPRSLGRRDWRKELSQPLLAAIDSLIDRDRIITRAGS